MKVLIGEVEFPGINTIVSPDMLTLNIKDENDSFSKLTALLPSIENLQIQIYGQSGTEDKDVVVEIYQAHQFYSIMRSAAGDSKVITVSLQISPIEVTQADKINQRIKEQQKTIESQATTIAEQQKTIDTQAATLAEQDKTNTLLKAQVKSVTDRADFVDDCIAEMATIVYA